MVSEAARSATTRLEDFIRDVPDFPESGVQFKDITPLLASASALDTALVAMAEPWLGESIDVVLGIEARGFILAVPVARSLDVGFVPARKPGKLPSLTIGASYGLEYGRDSIEIHADSIGAGQRVLIIDDVLATGGTASAAAQLVSDAGGELVGFGFLIDLPFLGGRARLENSLVHSVMSFGDAGGGN